MNRYFRGPRRCSLDQEDENLYENVQSRPRIPQTSRRQENYRVGQPRLQTSFDVLPYDHSPKGSPETRHSRTDTGNDTASLHKDRPFYDQARNVRGTNIREEINRSAFRQMKQNYEEEVCSLREYKNKLEESERAIHFLKERQVDMQKEITRQKEANIQLQNDYKLLQNKVINEQSELQDTKIRLQQCQKDLQGAQEENKRVTYDKIHLENTITQLKQSNDSLNTENGRLKADISNVETELRQKTRQFCRLNKIQLEKEQQRHQRASTETLTLQNKLRDTEQSLRQTEKKLQDMELSLQKCEKDLSSAQEEKTQETHIKAHLQTKMKQLKDVNNSLQNDNARLNADIIKLENDTQQLSRQMEQNRLQTEQLQKEGARRKMRNDITTLQNKLLHSEQALTDTQTQMQETELRFEQLLEERQSLEKQNVDHNIQNDRMRIEINYLQEALDTQQKSKHLLLQQYQVEIRSLQEENAQIQKSHDSQWSKESDALKTENGKLHAEKYRLNAENNRLQNQVAELRHEHSQLQADNAQLKEQMNDYAALQNKLFTTEQEFNTVKLELKETNDRLNECIGDQETKDNPTIVDLSDMNRPSKLAERYKDLYDNQWVDAYEILEKSVEVEEQIISILLDILIETKRFCDHQTEMEMDHILRVVTHKDSVQQSDVPVSVIEYIKSCRKSTVAETIKVKYKEYVDELKKSALYFVKHVLHIDGYLQECFEVCWLMSIQDTPVVLAPVLKHGDAFQADLYSPYTVTGKIVDYVVWPALLLHTNGPTLTKGVAQGMKKR